MHPSEIKSLLLLSNNDGNTEDSSLTHMHSSF